MSQFKKGDVVKMKSGGPKMTVSGIGDYSGYGTGPEDGVACVWFETIKGVQQPQEKIFDAAVLEQYASPAVGFRVSRG